MVHLNINPQKIDLEHLKSAINDRNDFIIMLGMYGCEPCDDLEKELFSKEFDSNSLEQVFYLKLRPSEFSQLKDRQVIEGVPVLLIFKSGEEIHRTALPKITCDFSKYLKKLSGEHFN